MFTRKRFQAPALSGDWGKDGPLLVRAISDYLLSLEGREALTITNGTGIDGTPIGANSRSTGYFSQGAVNSGTLSGKWHVAGAFDANVADSLPAIITSGGYGGGWAFNDTSVYAGCYVQSSGTQLNFFAGMSAGEKANQNLVLSMISDGRIWGYGLHNNANAVTGTTNQYIASGTYTPSLTNVSNVAASTMRATQWIRVGNVVHVAGQMDIDPTAATSTTFSITLPIASNLGNAFELGGVGAFFGGAVDPVHIYADPANDKAFFTFTASATANSPLSFAFSYVVL